MATNAGKQQAPEVTAAPSLFHSFTVPAPGSPTSTRAWAPAEPIRNGPWTETVGGMRGRPTGPDSHAAPESYPQYQENSTIVLSQESEHQEQSTDPRPSDLSVVPYGGVSLISNPRERPPAPSRMLRSPDNYRFFRPFDVWAAKHLNGMHSSGAGTPRYQSGISVPSKGMQVNFPTRRNTYRVNPPPRDVMIMDAPEGMQVPNYTRSDGPDVWPGSSVGRSFRLV
jgi:hypothetical protein